MDDTTNNENKSRKRRLSGGEEQSKRGGDNEEEQCDVEVWETLSKSFRQVQSPLDQNRALIQQANENHNSRVPDNLSKNFSLIRQINSNISKVISIYSDLSADFSTIVHQRRAIIPAKNDNGDDMDNRKLDRVKSVVESQSFRSHLTKTLRKSVFVCRKRSKAAGFACLQPRR